MAKNQPILIVDDEQDILDVYRATLEDEGFSVITASNGVEAIALAQENNPKLILMDVKMPVLDGIEALTKLKEDPKTKNLKVVFLTAFSDPNKPEVDANIAKELGAVDFIKKGISLTEFVEKVRGYLIS